jgi:hypothetical protein
LRGLPPHVERGYRARAPRLASPSCLEVAPLARDEPLMLGVPAPLAALVLVRNWQMVHVLPLFLFALHRCLRDVIRTRCRNGLNPALRQRSRRGLELSGVPAIGQHHPVTSPGRTPISKNVCCYEMSLATAQCLSGCRGIPSESVRSAARLSRAELSITVPSYSSIKAHRLRSLVRQPQTAPRTGRRTRRNQPRHRRGRPRWNR